MRWSLVEEVELRIGVSGGLGFAQAAEYRTGMTVVIGDGEMIRMLSGRVGDGVLAEA